MVITINKISMLILKLYIAKLIDYKEKMLNIFDGHIKWVFPVESSNRILLRN